MEMIGERVEVAYVDGEHAGQMGRQTFNPAAAIVEVPLRDRIKAAEEGSLYAA